MREDRVLERAQFGVARHAVGHGKAEPHDASFRLLRADEQADLVAVAALRLRQLREHRAERRRELVTVVDHAALLRQRVAQRLPGLAAVGDEAVRRGFDTVLGQSRVGAVTEPAFVHKAEVRHLEKVLNDARRAGRDQVRAAEQLAQMRVVFGFECGQRAAAGCHPNPHQPRGFAHFESAGAVRCRWRERRQGRDENTLPRSLELPAVVRALEPRAAFDHPPERELGAAVRAAVSEGVRFAGSVTPQHHVFSQQTCGQRRAAEFVGSNNRVPQRRFVHRFHHHEKGRLKCFTPGGPLSRAVDHLSPGTLPSTPLT